MVAPPDAPLARLDLALVLALGAGAIVGCGYLVPESWAAYYAIRLWLPVWLCAGVLHGGEHVQHRSAWLTRLTRLGRARLAAWGGGAYAAIVLACFLWLELAQVRDLVLGAVGLEWSAGVRDLVRELGRDLVAFFVGSVMNTIHALAWPAFWGKVFDAGAQWPAVIVAWLVFESGRHAVRRLVKPEPAERGDR